MRAKRLLKKRLGLITLVELPKATVASCEVTSGDPERESAEMMAAWLHANLGLKPGEGGTRSFGFDCHKGREIPEGCRIYHQYVTLPEGSRAAGDERVSIKEFPGGRFARVAVHDPFSCDFPLAWSVLLQWVFRHKIPHRLGCASAKDCYSLFSNEESPCLEEIYSANGEEYMAMYLPIK